MNTRKTIKNLAIILICLSAVALAGLNIYQHRQIQKTMQTTAPVPSSGIQPTDDPVPLNTPVSREDAKQKRVAFHGQNRTGGSEVDELVYQLEAAEEELSVVSEQLASEEAKKAERKKVERELQKKYLENPAYANSMKQSMLSQYKDLFDKLNLSSEKLEAFKDLLFEEIMAQQNMFLEYEDPNNLTQEQQKTLSQRLSALREDYETQKQELLGESEYATYQAYNETQAERYQVNNFMVSLGSSDTLTETQKETLIEAMSEEIQFVDWEPIDRGDGSSSKMYSEDNMAIQLANYYRRTDAYLKAANSILSASQLEEFGTYLDGQIEQYRIMLEMSALRSGSSGDTENVAVRVE